MNTSPALPPARGPLKLLIVDDSNIVRKAIERTLRRVCPIQFHMARNGLEALEIYREIEPDIVTLDITMPQMDGLTCLEAMRSAGFDAKVLVISALADRATAIEALKKGAEAYLCKPFTSGELIEVFAELWEDESPGGGYPSPQTARIPSFASPLSSPP